jgi:uncharacterized protein with HEPN domain
MPERRDEVLLEDILTSIQRIRQYIVGYDEATFAATSLVVDAVVRNLEIIGEASKRLSLGTKSRFPKVPWEKIAGLRNRIAHEYFGVDVSLVWVIVSNELSKVQQELLSPPV